MRFSRPVILLSGERVPRYAMMIAFVEKNGFLSVTVRDYGRHLYFAGSTNSDVRCATAPELRLVLEE